MLGQVVGAVGQHGQLLQKLKGKARGKTAIYNTVG
jgi:hypothetical protein